MLVIALTGGIGCGKSAVSSYLKSLNVPIIDADQLAHQLVEPGSPILREIQAVFGNEIVDTNGVLDRSALREVVFNDPQRRKQLEGILHPPIRKAMEEWVSKQIAPYVVLAIPLLFETRQTSIADRVLVVDCNEFIQIERVLKRDQISMEQINQILSSQVDRQTRLLGADDVIENNGSLEELYKDTEKLHRKYLNLAGS
ncbi:MAG: dephospho-CoA kinase [gamma proteobacterium symbiont of Ctena orbiculata]|nr:MAG: dephospho-CoA kinase [gamma proteobacterium symbiont of Ctena orbiculata]